MDHEEDHGEAEQNMNAAGNDVKRKPRDQPNGNQKEEQNQEDEVGKNSQWGSSKRRFVRTCTD